MSLLAADRGADMHRVHDVAPLCQALTLRNALGAGVNGALGYADNLGFVSLSSAAAKFRRSPVRGKISMSGSEVSPVAARLPISLTSPQARNVYRLFFAAEAAGTYSLLVL